MRNILKNLCATAFGIKLISPHARCLLLIMLTAQMLRWTLVLRGGQLYFPDEFRYIRGFILLHSLLNLDVPGVLRLLTLPDSPFFSVMAAPAIALQYITTRLAGHEFWSSIFYHRWVPALIISLPSTMNIALVYLIAKHMGASPRERLAAAFFMATSHSMLMYARHLLGYDAALMLFLLGILIGVRNRTRLSPFIAGIFAALGVLSYSGYYYLAMITVLLVGIGSEGGVGVIIRRALHTAAGGILSVTVWIATALLVHPDYTEVFQKYSRSILHGDFREGWILPWLYLADVERVGLVMWIIAMAIPVCLAFSSKRRPPRRWGAFMAAFLCIYAILVLQSNGLEIFVVYGRTARALIPFICLAAATAVSTPAVLKRPYIVRIAGTLLALHILWSFYTNFQMQFPRDVAERLAASYDFLYMENGKYIPYNEEFRNTTRTYEYYLVNAENPSSWKVDRFVPEGIVLFSTRHPNQYRHHQYEGTDHRLRARS